MADARPEAAAPVPARIAFLGLGLIGGSIARALRERAIAATLVAWTPDVRGPRAALADGVLDAVAASPREAIREADLVVLASPPGAVLQSLSDLAGPLRTAIRTGATITDVASTKAAIVERASAARLPFVGGHPMAGRETSGFEAATADLFVNRPWVMVPGAAASAIDVACVEWLATTVGARAVRMSAADHDRAVAAISHLPLVLAAALVEAVAGPGNGRPADDWSLARALAATGWTDMTRLARGDAAMGAGILATNAAEVASRLRDLRRVLDTWIDDLEQGSAPDDRLMARLVAARARLEDTSG
jgi:prephenate dehydrogenase